MSRFSPLRRQVGVGWRSLLAYLIAGGGESVIHGASISCIYNAPKSVLDTIRHDDVADAVEITNTASWRDRVNKITPRPATTGGGFWEISTSSVAEWPVQAREVEIFRSAQGIAIRTTMIDSDAPTAPTGALDLADLAALHREVAANDPGSVGGLDAEGAPEDRNVVLYLPAPAVPTSDRS